MVGDREKETVISQGEATKGVPGESREIKAMNDATRQVHRGTFNEWFVPRLRAPVTLGPGPIDEKPTRLVFLSPRSIHVRISRCSRQFSRSHGFFTRETTTNDSIRQNVPAMVNREKLEANS